MALNLWTLIFVLGLMKTRLDFFQGGKEENKTLKTYGAAFHSSLK